MPKSKEYLSSSEGSGSEEERPQKKPKKEEKPPKKEEKPPKKEEKKVKKKESSGSESDEEDNKFEIGRNRFVTVRTFKGKTYIDIREFYEKDGEILPGKKGISLTPEQWHKLKTKIPKINDSIERM